MNQKQELIRRLEIRQQQLTTIPTERKYSLHEGHHLRDVITVLAYLKNEDRNIVDKLINNLPV